MKQSVNLNYAFSFCRSILTYFKVKMVDQIKEGVYRTVNVIFSSDIAFELEEGKSRCFASLRALGNMRKTKTA